MRMRQREDVRRERSNSHNDDAYSGVFGVCGGGVCGVWVFGAAAASGSRALYFVDIFLVCFGGHRDWVGDVSVFAVKRKRKAKD